LGSLPHGKTRHPGPPLKGALRGGQPTGLARRDTSCRSRFCLEGLPGGQTSRALPPLAERKREDKIKTHEKKPKQRYPRILTRSRPGPIVPAGSPPGPRPSQALPRVAPLPTPAPPPPRAPEAPKGRPAQASSRRPEDQLPVQPARAPALGGQTDRPNSPESPQLPRPRGQVPPRPVPAPRTGTLVSRPQILMAPAHLEAGSATPGPASDLG
jgi:hypothetical protein